MHSYCEKGGGGFAGGGKWQVRRPPSPIPLPFSDSEKRRNGEGEAFLACAKQEEEELKGEKEKCATLKSARVPFFAKFSFCDKGENKYQFSPLGLRSVHVGSTNARFEIGPEKLSKSLLSHLFGFF